MNQSLLASGTRPRSKYLQGVLIPRTVMEALGSAVGSRHRAFSEHVASQEGPCGFLELLTATAPRYELLIHLVQDDHRQLGRALATLRMKILRSDPSQWQALASDLDAIDAAIAEHTRLEGEMLRDALEPA